MNIALPFRTCVRDHHVLINQNPYLKIETFGALINVCFLKFCEMKIIEIVLNIQVYTTTSTTENNGMIIT